MTTRTRAMITGVLLGLSVLSGCQSYNMETGMTLPSGWYLQHPPQYFPPSPPFPLSRELATLEEASSRTNSPRPAVPLP